APVDLAAVPAFTLGQCGPTAADTAGRSRCDPVNLVFPGTTFAVVTGALVTAGWSLIGVGSPEYVLEPATSELLPASVQLFETQGQGAAAARFHVRLWQLANGDTIGAVHHESGGVEHQIDLDWEAAEDEVVGLLCKAPAVCSGGGVIAEQQREQGNSQRWRGWRNDWRPAVIRLT
ncbi:MAG: hypothetical protein AB7P33_12015, partial [Dehalococcoidia bacterium]